MKTQHQVDVVRDTSRIEEITVNVLAVIGWAWAMCWLASEVMEALHK